jgi:hypothetical protein
MSTFGEILKDKFINGFIVALILGLGTVNAINNIGGSVLDHLLKVESAPWNWKIFYGQLILYLMLVMAAVFLRWCSKLSTHPPQPTRHPSHPTEAQPEHRY